MTCVPSGSGRRRPLAATSVSRTVPAHRVASRDKGPPFRPQAANRSVSTTHAPSAASRLAVARPMPVPAPVTKATWAASGRGLGRRRRLASITTAALAIAESGTIVLDGGPGQGRRAPTLVPDYHLCILRAGQIVAIVPQALG